MFGVRPLRDYFRNNSIFIFFAQLFHFLCCSCSLILAFRSLYFPFVLYVIGLAGMTELRNFNQK